MQTRKYDAEIGKVLDLMINALYTNKDIFLRELVSNASDACDKLRHLSIENPSLLEDGHQFRISVKIDKPNQALIIQDTGIGMNEEDMISSLGTIASSGTQKFVQLINSQAKPDLNLIGQFGVGFYSAFMVADSVTVVSRKAGETQAYIWQSAGSGEYAVGKHDGEVPVGTTITLTIKTKDEEYLDKFRLKHIISTYSDHIAFPIALTDEDGNEETVNKASALWMRPKSDISDEQYTEFYHHLAHSPDTPWMRIHTRAEGNVEYTSLLYIPSIKPFDLFHPDRKTRVKLYIKRVFITEETVQLIPQYMRFLRGIVDSEDLPLNISRETIQHSQVLNKIRKSLVKKILGELKQKAKNDPQDYMKFWNNFGEVLKEGLCEHALEEKEQLLEVCKFNSTNSQDELTSLDEYIDRMKEDQNVIYYITGDDVSKLRGHPSLEGFAKRGIEVLLLADYVDDFWVNVIPNYKNKELKSVAVSNINLDDVKSDEQAKTPEISDEELVALFKTALGSHIKEVKTTTKLVDSPACLAIPEGYMSSRMEKLLIEQKQLKVAAPKILEINPKHFIMHKIADALKSSNDNLATELAWLTFDQACVLEGERVVDPKKFVHRINTLLGNS